MKIEKIRKRTEQMKGGVRVETPFSSYFMNEKINFELTIHLEGHLKIKYMKINNEKYAIGFDDGFVSTNLKTFDNIHSWGIVDED